MIATVYGYILLCFLSVDGTVEGQKVFFFSFFSPTIVFSPSLLDFD